MTDFIETDAWVLLSVIYGQHLADKSKLKGIGDFINHAIFSDEELDGGLQRLKEKDYVIETNGLFGITPQVQVWYETVKSRTVFTELDSVKKFLSIEE